MSIDHCRKCGERLGANDIVLCQKCLEEWSTWYKEKGFKLRREKLREIRRKWYEGEPLP